MRRSSSWACSPESSRAMASKVRLSTKCGSAPATAGQHKDSSNSQRQWGSDMRAASAITRSFVNVIEIVRDGAAPMYGADMRRWPLLTLVACFTLAGARAHADGAPPPAPVRPVTSSYQGISITDPYRYLEKLDDPEVRAWLGAQGDFTRKTLDRIPALAALGKRVET